MLPISITCILEYCPIAEYPTYTHCVPPVFPTVLSFLTYINKSIEPKEPDWDGVQVIIGWHLSWPIWVIIAFDYKTSKEQFILLQYSLIAIHISLFSHTKLIFTLLGSFRLLTSFRKHSRTYTHTWTLCAEKIIKWRLFLIIYTG